MVEEKVFIVDMRESTDRGIWVDPDQTGPREKREGKSGRGRERNRLREEPRATPGENMTALYRNHGLEMFRVGVG